MLTIKQGASRNRRSFGFTLLELLVVMVIIGLLAGFVAPRYFAQVGKSRVKAAHAQIAQRHLPARIGFVDGIDHARGNAAGAIEYLGTKLHGDYQLVMSSSSPVPPGWPSRP